MSLQQGHSGNKTLHQQNPSVLKEVLANWLMQVDLYNGCKMVVVVVLLTEHNFEMYITENK